ncbi:RNA polymerase subunit sigma [Zobellella denitrificans]|uniref:RNA polymerase subunit sigma n=1 Tax=Zobellella denitrificans TaxID=347534 RepID=A0A231N0P0_9GAMM|nr:sigma-70 family RNA polymerase sigma factor [Zobellella denitrificans]ATG73884.1 RNA polymerase subunit sigma [Zobellella denitrificans]OXS15998.1 RNA polymerase subunit sigma [Zobellella denitrificans]
MTTPTPDTDYQALLAACARGERSALHRLYEREGSRLLGVVMRIVRDHALAEDIVHDALINIWLRADSFDPRRGSARGWIYSVVRHLALNTVRNRGRELLLDQELADSLDARRSFEHWRQRQDDATWAEYGGRIEHCLEQLEPERRSCLLHAYVDGCTHHEIAGRMGAPLGTVKAWIRRSLAALRECMA